MAYRSSDYFETEIWTSLSVNFLGRHMIQKVKTVNSQSRERYAVIAVCIVLAALVWVAFGATTHYGFINFDDDVYVYKNEHVTGGITGKAIRWAFTHVHSSNWHPITWLSHMLDCNLYGLNAGGHHFTNILVHTATCILLFLLLRSMTGFLWRSAIVAAIFAIHPLRAESVAWIAERKDVLSGLFFMLTLAVYGWYARRPWSLARYLVVMLMFSLALMSKPMVVTIPFVLLLLDYWPLKRLAASGGHLILRRCVLDKIPLLLLSAMTCLVTVLAQHEAVSPLPLPLRLSNAAVSSIVYVQQMFFPSGLVALYPFPEHGLPYTEIFLACSLLTAISATAFLVRRQCPWLMCGWFWYLGMLVPVIGVLQVGAQAHADRYTYLPQIGLAIALVWSAAEIVARSRRYQMVLSGAAAAVIILLTVCAHQQTAYWQNSRTLWTRALAFTSDNIVAHNNLGNALLDDGKVDEAIGHFKEARRIKPQDPKAAFNLGNALIQRGELTEGISNLSNALELNPDYTEAHINLGGALLKTGKVDDAAGHFQKALQLEPAQPSAWNDLGYARLQQGSTEKALVCFQKAMQFDPTQPVTLDNIANAFMQQEKVDEAIHYYQRALQIKPDFAEAEYNLGTALVQQNNLEEAIVHFKKALRLKPDYANAAYNIAIALFHQDKASEATVFFQKAIQINPDYGEAYYNLGNALIRQGKVEDGIGQFRKALQIEPGQLMTRNNLGYVLLQSGKLDEAIDQFTRVLQTQPDNANAHYNLGNALLQKGNPDDALEHFQQALQHEPGFAEAHYSLGTALLQKERETDALAQFQQAILLKPDYSEALNDLAWELATAPLPVYRDGKRAVEFAERADRLTGGEDLDILDTVAAAYAEAHRFEEAIGTVRQAIAVARSSGQENRVAQLNSELALYEAGQPFHRNGKN
jgi:tetratricopeptide (TPR) repeat protein